MPTYMSIAIGIITFLFIVLTPIYLEHRRLMAFRKGIIWGLKLFAHSEKDTNGNWKEVVGQQKHPLEDLIAEIKNGRWDNVLKN